MIPSQCPCRDILTTISTSTSYTCIFNVALFICTNYHKKKKTNKSGALFSAELAQVVNNTFSCPSFFFFHNADCLLSPWLFCAYIVYKNLMHTCILKIFFYVYTYLTIFILTKFLSRKKTLSSLHKYPSHFLKEGVTQITFQSSQKQTRRIS